MTLQDRRVLVADEVGVGPRGRRATSSTVRRVQPLASERAILSHSSLWGAPDLVARAPGRVNLIGEHTDYNDGFALPMALRFDTVVALTDTRDDGNVVRISAEGFGAVAFDPESPDDTEDLPTWARHLVGVVRILGGRGVESGGWSATVATDIPIGAGLSSSAAVEVAAVTALLGRLGSEWSPLEVAQIGQQAENEYVGVPSGIMDQLISAGARTGHAGLMDCRSLTIDHTPVPAGLVIAVLDTGTRRTLSDGAYRDRRRSCEQAAEALGVAALRDASGADVQTLSDPDQRRRARHVVSENERTLRAAAALAAEDPAELGRLMVESHHSLRSDFEVSGAGLDAIVEVAVDSPGCLGARMTGGGFAGCAVAAVELDAIAPFTASVTDRYRYDGLTAQVWASDPAGGAGLIAVG